MFARLPVNITGVLWLLQESQSRVCTTSCQYHKWQADEWGPCLPYGESACGPGTQTRNVG